MADGHVDIFQRGSRSSTSIAFFCELLDGSQSHAIAELEKGPLRWARRPAEAIFGLFEGPELVTYTLRGTQRAFRAKKHGNVAKGLASSHLHAAAKLKDGVGCPL